MKNLSRSLIAAVCLLPLISLSSCEKNSNDKLTSDDKLTQGLAEFSVSIPEAVARSSKGTDSVETVFHLMISVTDTEGNPVITDKLVPLYTFGTSFLSENIQLKSGDFRLTKFLVINSSGEVIFAAPVAGSPLAYLVIKPLPLPFSITSDHVTRIVPEVLAVNGMTPDKFGYAAFGIQVIKPLDIWTYCIIDNPLAASPLLITSAKLTVSTPSGWNYSYRLSERVNHLIIRGGADVYSFVLQKENYPPQTLRFTAQQLLATSPDNPLVLKIPSDSQFRLIVLQPGPLTGVDAMISDLEPEKNFGGHSYFEATFLSEPILTVMRANRSLIAFNTDILPESAIIKRVILTLCYDIPVPIDSIYMPHLNSVIGPDWYGAVFQRIIEPWNESTVTWNSQPKTTETNQVYLWPFIKNANFIEVDVTHLFTASKNTTPNYGLLFKQWPSERFPGFRFVSGDYPVEVMRPKLKIFYVPGK